MNQICKICGCSEKDPCYHPEHGNCSWAEEDLCSHCVLLQEGKISKDEMIFCRANKDNRHVHVEFEICLQVNTDSNGRMLISTSTNPESVDPIEVEAAMRLYCDTLNLKKQ